MNKHTGGVWVKRKVDLGRAGSGFAIDFNEDQEQVVDYVYAEDDADVICEAGNIYNKTGLTPNRVLEQRDELLEALECLLVDIEGLVSESEGVQGLHLNGDLAPWCELEEGGQFERLSHISAARAALAKAKGGTK